MEFSGRRMQTSDPSEDQFESSLNEGMLGDEYEIVGFYNDDADSGSEHEFEIFIVSVGTEV